MNGLRRCADDAIRYDTHDRASMASSADLDIIDLVAVHTSASRCG